MQKKAIEQIETPHVKLVDKKYKMIMTSQRAVIGKTPYLICDFFYNRKKDIKKRWLRVIVSKSEFGNIMHDGSWNTKKMLTKDYDHIWNVGADRNTRDWNICKDEIYVSEVANQTIRDFDEEIDGIPPLNYHSWEMIIRSLQNDITQVAEQKRYEKANRQLKDLIDATDDTIPNDFKEWCKRGITLTYLYYKRTDRRHAMINCSECGENYLITFNAGDTYEQHMCEEISAVPESDQPCMCKKCGAVGIYKQYGRMKNSTYGKTITRYMIQPCKDSDTAVVRMFKVEKYLNTDYPARYSIFESGRMYINKNLCKKYWKVNVYSSNGYDVTWSMYNPGSYPNPEKDQKGLLWHGSNIEDTFLRYSQIDKYALLKRDCRPYAYAKAYKEIPELEMVMKLKMHKLADELVERGSCILYKGSSIVEKLGIDKKNFKELIRLEGDWDIVQMMRMEKQLGFNLTVEQRLKLAKFNYTLDDNKFAIALKYMSVEKFMNRIIKYAGIAEWPEKMRGCIFDQIKHQITTYLDYLDMRDRFHHDLDNSIHQCPRFLKAAHDELVVIQNKEKDEQYIKDKMKRYPEINNRYEELCKKYEVEFAGLHIRPARDAGEIVMEGRVQHHCVGGDNYLDKHNTGKSIILLMRHVECPQAAYVTVEIKGNEIVQWYGAHDVKIDKEQNEEWLKHYKKFLKTRKIPKIEHIEVPLVAAV